MQIMFLKLIAVYSSYRHLFHNKKSTTIFIKLEVRWAGKRGRSTFWNDFSNQHSHWYPRPTARTLPSQWQSPSFLPFLGGRQEEGVTAPPADCSTPLCPSVFLRWRSGKRELPLSPASYSELTVLSFKEEEEQEEELLRCKAGRWDWRAAQTQRKDPTPAPDYVFIS